MSAAGLWQFRCQRCYKRFSGVALGRPLSATTREEANAGISLAATDAR
jgi:hypothetical protein